MYRILAVEDDPIMQKFLRDALQSDGYEVFVRGSGEEGIAAAMQEKPDLILLDVHLPGIDGLEACRRIKANGDIKHIPCVVLTGEARDLSQRIEGLDVGAEDYLFKPVSLKVLLSRVRGLLKQTVRTGREA